MITPIIFYVPISLLYLNVILKIRILWNRFRKIRKISLLAIFFVVFWGRLSWGLACFNRCLRICPFRIFSNVRCNVIRYCSASNRL